jgi:carbonic anhydrase
MQNMNQAKNCVIHCIDFRFQKHIENWMYENSMLDNSDLIAIAGSSRDFVKPIKQEHKENWLRELDTSVKLHNPENIIIIDHQDCGGYSIDGTIASELGDEEDKTQHKIWLLKTKEEIQSLYKDKIIRVLYVDKLGNFTEF